MFIIFLCKYSHVCNSSKELVGCMLLCKLNFILGMLLNNSQYWGPFELDSLFRVSSMLIFWTRNDARRFRENKFKFKIIFSELEYGKITNSRSQRSHASRNSIFKGWIFRKKEALHGECSNVCIIAAVLNDCA